MSADTLFPDKATFWDPGWTSSHSNFLHLGWSLREASASESGRESHSQGSQGCPQTPEEQPSEVLSHLLWLPWGAWAPKVDRGGCSDVPQLTQTHSDQEVLASEYEENDMCVNLHPHELCEQPPCCSIKMSIGSILHYQNCPSGAWPLDLGIHAEFIPI